MIERAFHQLHSIRKMRELMRSWWRIELGFAYPDGYVADHELGKIFPSDNPFCSAALHSPEGFQACNSSIEKAVLELRDVGGTKVRAMLVETCHLGFPILFVPLVYRGEFLGALFTSGFLREGDLESRSRAIIEMSEAAGIPAGVSSDEALRHIPILKVRDFSYLCDLMEMMGEEILQDPGTTHRLTFSQHGETGREGVRLKFEDIIGQSAQMQELFSMIEKVAPSDSTVLITGEDGTGKELVAQAIYRLSRRKGKPFVARNCSALNDNLLESELFGHVRGSFTGASGDRAGVFEQADSGTLFLDEIGDTSGQLQVRLLRVLQEGTFVPVGGTEERSTDVRLVTATNRPLKEMVAEESFRKDLYYRLNIIRLHLPPLRERMDDLPFLCAHFLSKLAERTGQGEKQLGPGVLQALFGYDWPGNIRELQGELERMYVLSGQDKLIQEDVLNPELTAVETRYTNLRDGSLAETLRDVEQEVIKRGLIRTHWNKSQLAIELGVSRTTLIRKVKEYGLEKTENGSTRRTHR